MVRRPSLRAEVSATNDGKPWVCLKYIKPRFSHPRTEVTVKGVAGATNPNAEPKNNFPEFWKAPILAKSYVETTLAFKALKAMIPVLVIVPLAATTPLAKKLVLVT